MSIKSLDELKTIKTPEPSEAYIHPGINRGLLAWLVFLGLPALLMFLIIEKSQRLETLPPQAMPQATVARQHALPAHSPAQAPEAPVTHH